MEKKEDGIKRRVIDAFQTFSLMHSIRQWIGVVIGLVLGDVVMFSFLETHPLFLGIFCFLLALTLVAIAVIFVNRKEKKRREEEKKRMLLEKSNSLISEMEEKLPQGCEYLAKNMVIKNALRYLHDIDVLHEQWEMTGYGGEQKLSDLLWKVLKDRIINGDEININLFNHRLYEKVVQHSSSDAFAYFLRDLKDDIERQRKYGCLKLLATLREVGKNE